ncbi:hypothetical protein L1049_003029 [Liquidambar formosana]|uniref:Uncharacterized protein n=1 Tax=Liquidambar formosana TaxID=63359 RepID=A0AAP0R9A5_LIQFO
MATVFCSLALFLSGLPSSLAPGETMWCLSEDIMLKDAWINVGVGNYSLDEYHCEGVAADTLAEDTLSPHPMDIVMVVSHPSHNLSNLEEFTDNLEENRFFHEKGLEFEMFNVAEEEYPDFVRPIGEEHQSGEEYPDSVRPIGEEHQNGEDQRKVSEKMSFENAKYQVITEDYNSRNLEASIEMLRDKRFSQEECVDLERFGGAEEEPPDLVRNFDEEHDATNATPINSLEMTSSQNRKHHFIAKDHPLSITVDATLESKFPDASGATTPEFMVISTPANKERARTPSKRKCFLDNDVVLANKVLRESIHDSSGLVCKRRKVPHSALDAWKACRIPNLSQGFLEPLFPCTSLELGSIFYKKKSKTREPVETVETPERLDLPGSTVDRPSVDFPGSVIRR